MNAEIKIVWSVLGFILGVLCSIVGFYIWIHTPKADSKPIADNKPVNWTPKVTKRTADQSKRAS